MSVVTLTALFMTAAVVGALALLRGRKRRFDRALRELGERVGLSVHGGRLLHPTTATGFFDRARVTVDTCSRRGRSSELSTRIRVSFPSSLVTEVKRDSLGSSLQRALGGGAPATGDEHFDRAVVIRGPGDHLVALLDEPTRRLLRDALAEGIVLDEIGTPGTDGGQVRWQKTGLVSNVDTLERLVRLCVRVSQRLSERLDMPARLLSNAVEDPVVGVRERNLDLLLTRYAASPEALEAARQSGGHPNHALRLKAALLLGTEGHDPVRELALDEEASVSVRADALGALWASSALDAVTLEQLLERPADALTGTTLRLLRTQGPIEERVLRRHAQHLDSVARREVAVGLAAHPGSQIQDVLLTMLAREDEENPVLIALIEGLAGLGDRLAVEPLLPFTKGLFADGDVKAAARRAVTEIQGRLGNADAGRLTLVVDTTGGELTLAEDGGLVVSDEDAGSRARLEVIEESSS